MNLKLCAGKPTSCSVKRRACAKSEQCVCRLPSRVGHLFYLLHLHRAAHRSVTRRDRATEECAEPGQVAWRERRESGSSCFSSVGRIRSRPLSRFCLIYFWIQTLFRSDRLVSYGGRSPSLFRRDAVSR